MLVGLADAVEKPVSAPESQSIKRLPQIGADWCERQGIVGGTDPQVRQLSRKAGEYEYLAFTGEGTLAIQWLPGR